ncbi:hyaluronidase PH-20-like [Discoglossus pictus]
METVTYDVVFHRSLCRKVLYCVILSLFPCCETLLARAPPLADIPFVSIWNAPTELCKAKFDINVDVRLFQIVGSTLSSARGQNITLFYTDRLGYYPSINIATGMSYNGGIPQMTNMVQHLNKAKKDILYYVPSDTQQGLAVIDWEDWRPNWIRNWASKLIYRNMSIEYAQEKDPTLSQEKAKSVAKVQFESAAKSLMLNTLNLGKSLRPHHLWGFFNFPNCQNYDYNQNPKNYTGHCPTIEMLRNDELRWLWKKSTAFYVNIYLETSLKSSNNAALYSRYRIREALRLSNLSNSAYSLPVYVYAYPVFTDRYEEYLSTYDLINTIGESAALGAAGFVAWGDLKFTLSTKTCTALNDYLTEILNPYIINVTLATKLCSKILCQSNGACVRKQWNTKNYLHLNGKSMVIELKDGTYTVRGQPTIEDLNQFKNNFICHCYAGKRCKPPSNLQNIGQINVCMSPNICINASYIDKLEASDMTTTITTTPMSPTPSSPNMTTTITTTPISPTTSSPNMTTTTTTTPMSSTISSPNMTTTITTTSLSPTTSSPNMTTTITTRPISQTISSPHMTTTTTATPMSPATSSPNMTTTITTTPMSPATSSPNMTTKITTIPMSPITSSPNMTTKITTTPMSPTTSSPSFLLKVVSKQKITDPKADISNCTRMDSNKTRSHINLV